MSNQRFSITPAAAAADKDLQDTVYRTLAVIGMYGDRNGWCWPSQQTIADIRGVTRKTINLHIKELTERGYLNIAPRYDEETGAQKSNMMQVKFDYEPQDVTPPVTSIALHPVLPSLCNTPPNILEVTHNAPLNDPKERSEEEAAAAAVYTAYHNNIGELTPMISDEIGDALDEFGKDWVLMAIEEAVKSNVKRWRYIAAILKRWKVEGRGDNRQNGNGAKSPSKTDKAQAIVTAVSTYGSRQGGKARDSLGELWPIVQGVEGGWSYLCGLSPKEIEIKIYQQMNGAMTT